ncbi:MAG: hypothetical protein NUV67_00715, partial [archaeon]|nr:hypothetical protein [archaeon]
EKNFTPESSLGYDDWPKEYKDACEQQMRAVIKQCAGSGYENWTVSRMMSSTQFIPVREQFSISDKVVGNYSCGYLENSNDAVLTSGAILNFACSEKDFVSGEAISDQYACSFTCSAWDCDEGNTPNDIFTCSVKAENIKEDVDPYDQIDSDCQDVAERQCKNRSKWWKLKFCDVKRPCEFRNKDEYFGDVFCECSCPEENPKTTIGDATLREILADSFDPNTPVSELNLGDREGCFGDKVIPSKPIDTQTPGSETDTISDSVKERILDSTTLDFSDNAGQVPKDPATGTSIIGQINNRNTADITNLINESDAGAAALLGTQLGLGAAHRNDAYIMLSGPGAKTSIERENKAPDFTPPATPQEVPEAESESDSACDESSCGEWSGWIWGYCQPGGKQIAARARVCGEQTACDLEETKERSCTYSPPNVFLEVDGEESSAVLIGNGKGTKIVVDGGDRAIDYGISVDVQVNGESLAGFPVVITDPVTSCGPSLAGSGSRCEVVLSDESLDPDFGPIMVLVNSLDGEPISESTFNLTSASEVCVENWSCGSWGSCASGSQARTCTDANVCGTTANKPATSQSCGSTPSCSESWSCGEYGLWAEWSDCGESGSQTRARTRDCTDANSCGTTASKPGTTDTQSQSCDYTPTQVKEEYSQHESELGSSISNLNYSGASAMRDITSSGGTYGYRILNIPANATIKSCVSASLPLEFHYYPQYPYGFDFTDTDPGCTEIYNKNGWANGVLLHLGYPAPVNTNTQVTITQLG